MTLQMGQGDYATVVNESTTAAQASTKLANQILKRPAAKNALSSGETLRRRFTQHSTIAGTQRRFNDELSQKIQVIQGALLAKQSDGGAGLNRSGTADDRLGA